MVNLVSFVLVSFITFGVALEPVFGGVIFWVVRDMAKVVENEVSSFGPDSSSSEDISEVGR